jgi:hypothetical protein
MAWRSADPGREPVRHHLIRDEPMGTPLLLAAALLAAGVWVVSPAAAQQQAPPAQQAAPSMGSPAAGTAAQGGEQGDCPAGQVRSAGGGCAPGQPDAAGTTAAGSATGGADMPASPHQQELLKGQQGNEVQPQPQQ